ncbi:hypothetical protein M404DRAFT_28111 [Pisolithus tinctorius Marx 270]|uniref:Uncharacterized protein n=1 Tax=Pisolithus tinctorius Marx 270 TaxID=870435 RepID=A0A0C3NMT9_PISTI|nr:hypothetical protein M404DRAFT_28111 [Pisolithus tinctorius Marx 270]
MVKQLRKQKVISSDDESESSFPQPSQKPASNSIVDSVLHSMFSQPPSTSNYSCLPTKTQPSTSVKASIHQAHAEANKGLKGKSRSTSYRQTFRKEGETEKGLRGRPRTLDFLIARIVFLPYGVDMVRFASSFYLHFYVEFLQPSFDEDSDLSRLEAAGLARSNFRSYFTFNWEWSWTQVDNMLRGEFPRLFEVLDTQPKVFNVSYNTSGMVGRQYKYLPPYLLCLRSHKEVVVAGGVEFPDGEVLFQKLKAGKQPSRDESEIIFITHNEILFKLIIQWVKKQHPKGKGKHKAETDSGAEDSESQLWTKSDSGDDADDPILSPISHGIKRRRIDVHDSDSEEAGPSHAGPSTSTTPDTIDLTDGPMDVTAPSDELPLLPAPPSTLPSTPIQTHTQLAPSSSFMIDTSLTNPWKGNRTFQF